MAQSFADWQLADVSVTPKGAKQCLLIDGAGKQPVIYVPDELLVVPFGNSSWEESTRKNLELRCTGGVEAFFLQLDDWARAYLVRNSERLFKKQLTPEQVAENYKSPLQKKAIILRCSALKSTQLGLIRSASGTRRDMRRQSRQTGRSFK